MKKKICLAFVCVIMILSVFISSSVVGAGEIKFLSASGIEAENGYVKGICSNVKASDFLKYVETADVELQSSSGKSLTSDAFIGTGTTVKLKNDSTKSLTLVILGDTDGDGNLTPNDYISVKMLLKCAISLKEAFKIAADTDSNGSITSTDYIKIKRHFSGTFNLYSDAKKDDKFVLLASGNVVSGKDIDITKILQSLNDFSFDTTGKVLEETMLLDKNATYSPISFYYALGMLSESTDKETRDEILKAMKVESIDVLRSQASILFRQLYIDKTYSEFGIKEKQNSKLFLTNSLWAAKKYKVKQSLADSLAKYYNASSFSGEFNKKTIEQIRQFIRDNTNNLLGDNFEIDDPSSIVTVLLNTLYFKDSWAEQFDSKNTYTGKFDTGKSIVNVDYMRKSETYEYAANDKYDAVSIPFTNCGRMVFVRPSTNSSVEEIIMDSKELGNAINFKPDHSSETTYMINLELPKFDFGSSFDLTALMETLGMSHAINPMISDFTPTTDFDGIAVSKVIQETKVILNETGVEAAAYTAIMTKATGIPTYKYVDFKLDKPFIFAILGPNDTPLFIGTVYNPSAK